MFDTNVYITISISPSGSSTSVLSESSSVESSEGLSSPDAAFFLPDFSFLPAAKIYQNSIQFILEIHVHVHGIYLL